MCISGIYTLSKYSLLFKKSYGLYSNLRNNLVKLIMHYVLPELVYYYLFVIHHITYLIFQRVFFIHTISRLYPPYSLLSTITLHISSNPVSGKKSEKSLRASY